MNYEFSCELLFEFQPWRCWLTVWRLSSGSCGRRSRWRTRCICTKPCGSTSSPSPTNWSESSIGSPSQPSHSPRNYSLPSTICNRNFVRLFQIIIHGGNASHFMWKACKESAPSMRWKVFGNVSNLAIYVGANFIRFSNNRKWIKSYGTNLSDIYKIVEVTNISNECIKFSNNPCHM